jgi:hypothetical protein
MIVRTVRIKEKGVYHLSASAANADWLHAARLKAKADNGDEEAKREFEEMDNTEMIYVTEEDE